MATRYSDIVREAVAAFNRRDFAIVPKLLSEDVELRESPEWPQAGVYRGIDAFVGYFGRLLTNVDGIQGEVLDTVEEGERVLAQLHAQSRETDAGNAGEVSFSAIFTFRDGKCVRLEAFLGGEFALQAWRAGSEEEAGRS